MKPSGKRIRASLKAVVLPLLLWGTAVHTPIAMAQPAGTFTATGNMSAARIAHSATLLPNSRVLIAGGRYLATAELYDALTGTFTATGNMTMGRQNHTATLLNNGKVLIAGGASNDNSALAGAELYDPSTGTFSEARSMTVPRTGHTATLLPNGKVLIAGGASNVNSDLASAELYDPSTDTFTATGNMTTARSWHTATLLPNEKVLIAGASAELYDPDTGTFSPTGGTTFPSFLMSATASLLTNGKVLLTLVYDSDASYSAAVYDPSTQTFIATGNMTTVRVDRTATLLPNGKVLIAGMNYSAPGTAWASADQYDPAAGTFSPTGDMTTGRAGHTATLLPDGTVLIAGDAAWTSTPITSASAELFNPQSQAAPVLLSLSGDGRGQGAILHSGTPLVASSGNPAVVGEELEIYCTGLVEGSASPQVAIGGQTAEILFFGKTPGFAGRLNQMNVRMPSGIAPNPAVPVRMIYLGRQSNEVTIGVR